jgi:hypothetical protein
MKRQQGDSKKKEGRRLQANSNNIITCHTVSQTPHPVTVSSQSPSLIRGSSGYSFIRIMSI